MTKKMKVKEKKVKGESFFKGVRNEMKQVKWPTAKEVIKYSIATILLAVFVMLFFLLLEFILSAIKGVF